MKTMFFAIGLAIIGTHLPQAALSQSDAQALNAFKKADTNNDGILNKTEFREFIKAMAELGHGESNRAVRLGAIGYGMAWRQADRDKNGTVNLDELQAIR